MLVTCCTDCSGFSMRPQHFPQSAFDRPKNAASTHFFAANAVKFRMILDKMRSEIPANSFFILYNLGNLTDLNIGLMLLKNTPQLFDYFLQVAETIESTGGQDQEIVNRTLPSSGLNYTTFSLEDALQSNMREELPKNTFCALQLLCSNRSYEENIYEKLLSALYFFDINPVLEFVPAVVKEALVLYCRDHCPTNPVAFNELPTD